MPDPITTIDPGHSGAPGAVATPWEETRRALETAEVFWLATVRADGRPHVTPVAAAWLDGTLYFGTGAITRKLKNMRKNPHVVLTTGCNHLYITCFYIATHYWQPFKLVGCPAAYCAIVCVKLTHQLVNGEKKRYIFAISKPMGKFERPVKTYL